MSACKSKVHRGSKAVRAMRTGLYGETGCIRLFGVRERATAAPRSFRSAASNRRSTSLVYLNACWQRAVTFCLSSAKPVVTVVRASLVARGQQPAQGLNKRRRTNSAICACTSTRLSQSTTLHDTNHDKFAQTTILRGLVNACRTLCCARVHKKKRSPRHLKHS